MEYLRSWALEAIGAAEAYALGYTGEGVTIGVVDFGFDFASSEVDYHASSVGPNAQAVAWFEAIFGPNVDAGINHGHAVAAVAAGIKNNLQIHGIAFDARVLAVDYFSNVNPSQFVEDGYTYHVTDPWTYLTSRGVKIINKSFGYEEGSGVEIPPGVTDIYTDEFEAVAIDAGAIVIAAAGNSGGANPMLSNRDTVEVIEAFDLEDGPGAFVIVGSVKQTISGYQISSFSNRAGDYAEYFMVAPGEEVVFPLNAPECGPSFLCVGSGTSFATPMVSGAAALVLQRWPTLTGREIADILFASATDLGDPGIDAIYGHGMLNVFAALQPLGVTTLGVPNGIVAHTAAAGIVLGNAFGDAPALKNALAAVPIRDSFNRDFGINLSSFLWTRPRSDVAGLIEQKTRWKGAQYAVGLNANVSVRLYDRPALPYRAVNGLEEPETYRGVVEFRGGFNGLGGVWSWSAGNGLGLSTALGSGDPLSAAPLTRAFSGVMESETGHYATLRTALNERTEISFGVAHARSGNYADHYLDALDEGSAFNAAALRLDYRAGKSIFNFELGGAFEDGAVLGSYGTGALTLAERSTTMWTNIGGEIRIASLWSLKGALSAAVTDPVLRPGTLIGAFTPILTSGFSFGLERTDLFETRDRLRFTIHQPLRAEKATLTLFQASVDSRTGAPNVSPSEIALTPSGREIAFELGYGAAFGAWMAEASLAYRFDAGHVAGADSAAAVMFLSRQF